MKEFTYPTKKLIPINEIGKVWKKVPFELALKEFNNNKRICRVVQSKYLITYFVKTDSPFEDTVRDLENVTGYEWYVSYDIVNNVIKDN